MTSTNQSALITDITVRAARTSLRSWIDGLLPWAVVFVFTAWFFANLRFDLGWIYGGSLDSDALLHATFIKTLIESGWVFDNPRLGAPFGTSFLDFPGADGVLVLFLKFFSIFTSDPSVVLNLFYVSGFPLVFAAAYWVFRRVGVGTVWATVGALIYTCIPYHFLRGSTHLYLSNYFVVPLLVWAALRIYPGEQASAAQGAHASRWDWQDSVVLIFGGSAGVYYAFFGIFLLLTAGLMGAMQERSFRTLQRAVLAAAVVIGSVFVNLSPYIAYRISEGANPEIGKRVVIETEIYGLKAAQMLLPVQGHQVPEMAEFTAQYQRAFPVTEASSSALGVVTSAGFSLLVVFALLGRWEGDPRVALLARMNLALFCFAAVGGFAIMFAMLVTPQFRGINRASIVIAFMSLLGLFIWLQQAWKDRKGLAALWWAKYALAAAVAALALYDQIPVGVRPENPPLDGQGRLRPDATAVFVRDMEALLPAGAMVYVMPYLPFPEQAPAFEEGYNALLRPYYYSRHTRWSYGAMRGRTADRWLKAVEALPLPERVAALQKSGFSGIYVERKGFRDHGAALEAGLRALVPDAPLESADRERVFYRLRPDPHPQLTPAFLVRNGVGTSTREQDQGSSWFWSTHNGELLIENLSGRSTEVRLTTQLSSLDQRRIRVKFQNTTILETTLQPSSAVPVTLALTLMPGITALKLESDTTGVRLPTDSRELAVRWTQPAIASR